MGEGWEAVVVPGQKEGHSSLRASVTSKDRRRCLGQADSCRRAKFSKDGICLVSMREREGPGLRGMIL